jgi:hypothetical protein
VIDLKIGNLSFINLLPIECKNILDESLKKYFNKNN